MQPNFANLKPVGPAPTAQPNFGNLKSGAMTPPSLATAGASFNPLKSFTGTAGPTAGSTQAIPDNSTPDTLSAIGNTAKSLVSGTIESGKDIGAAISAPIVQAGLNKLAKADQDGLSTIIKLRQQAKASGQDTTHYDNLIKNFQTSNGGTVADVFPQLLKSNEQVIGDFGSMFLELLGGSSGLTAGASRVAGETAGANLTTRLLKGSLTGAEYGAGFGATGAMQQNASPEGIAKSTLVGELGGAVTGGLLEGAFGKRPAGEIAAKESSKIEELISPKLTSKETKLAESQGRLVKGREPTLFRGGTPDEVLPSAQVTKSTQTIQREIPGASKMSEPELYTALQGRTTDMAQKLQPEMEKVPVTPQVTNKIKSSYEELKKTQIKNADASEEANVLKRQAQFDERLKKVESYTNMDEVWKERISYDDSIPDNVKKATTLSDSRLQAKKEEWLQNRAILNNAITDLSTGLGSTAKQSFSDMTDMYGAKQNILSKAKVELKPQPSKAVQWAKKHPYITGTVVGAAATATGIPKKALDIVTGGTL